MLETALLATVAAVVREGSFERAARTLHITPSAVSQRIRLAEERVGTVLVVRGQPCMPTEAGARLCRHADTVALLESELHREMPALRSEGTPSATIRIAINADSMATWFVRALQLFCEGGNTLLDVVLDDQDKTSEWLRRGQVLAAVCSLGKPVQGCRSRKLGALRYCATASPAFVQRWFSEGVNAESLARAPSLVFDRNDRLQEQWVRRAVRKDVPLPAHRLPSSQGFVDASLAGVGWGMNPTLLVKNQLETGRLVELLPERRLDIPLYWQVAKLPLPELTRLSECVQRVASQTLFI
ncbi:ArgP/LysG family DNA-binding transcriptional regulator [Rhodoferax sp. TH121]|uniref:LysR family transcriptional regulator ArgP n=1 Tax=Rhodoferax sp. TH121 TaxID=2022803 RepID=UPI000B97CA60|nr:LysR family transcriptional regulator ArgP [Rhodoferax sp. TH121]OYQ40041.1 ArgP/LysG family DNA-binding transcriptional regulator [Rhodoferax sp. TH121]